MFSLVQYPNAYRRRDAAVTHSFGGSVIGALVLCGGREPAGTVIVYFPILALSVSCIFALWERQIVS